MAGWHSLIALAAGWVLDLVFGDPHGFPHIVVFYGRLIDRAETFLRPRLPRTKSGERLGGLILTIFVASAGTLVPLLVIGALYAGNFWLGFAAESFVCYQLLATRSLRDESLKVYDELKKGDLPGARRAVSMIVGRDPDVLDEVGVTKAAVETVAENAGDGVVAPLFWIGLFGVGGGCFCKAVNTMDSMIAYKNGKYRYFGTVAAKLDDAVNFVPARLAGLLTVLAAAPLGFDAGNAWRIFKRDRLKHESPNSAHTEAAFAGALRVRLAGPAQYEGRVEDKPYLGDPLRPVEFEDIRRAHRLLYALSFLAFALACAARFCLILF